jgi:hypothetical protein
MEKVISFEKSEAFCSPKSNYSYDDEEYSCPKVMKGEDKSS